METSERKEKQSRGILKFFLGVVALVMVFVVLFHFVSAIFVHPADDRSYSMLCGIYEEEPNSLDAVCIGASTTYAFWNPMIAWENFGISGYSYTSPGQPFSAQRYLCEEARKTQPDAVYLFNLAAMTEYFESDEELNFHLLLDFIPFSLTKLKLTHAILNSAYSDLSAEEKLEYYLPIIRYHSTWTDLKEENFHLDMEHYKGAASYPIFAYLRKNITDIYKFSDGIATFEDKYKCVEEDINETINYIKKENVKAFFVISPVCGKEPIYYESVNAAKKMVEDAGIKVLDLRPLEAVDAMHLDFKEDFYDGRHVNLHGSIKTTKYIAEFMKEEFGLKDKRNDATYSVADEWNEAAKQYRANFIKNYALDQEYTYQIDYTSETPAIFYDCLGGGKLRLYWDSVEGADCYEIYKKDSDKKPWEKVTTLSGDKTQLYVTDKAGKDIYYTIIAKVGDHWTNYYERGRKIAVK